MAHSYFNDDSTPGVYGTRAGKKSKKKKKKVNIGNATKRVDKLRKKIKTSRKSETLEKLGGMHDRTSDPFGSRR